LKKHPNSFLLIREVRIDCLYARMCAENGSVSYLHRPSLASKPCPDREHPGLIKTLLTPRLPSPLIRIDYTSGASTSKDLWPHHRPDTHLERLFKATKCSISTLVSLKPRHSFSQGFELKLPRALLRSSALIFDVSDCAPFPSHPFLDYYHLQRRSSCSRWGLTIYLVHRAQHCSLAISRPCP
jgi:hypothetical protein